MEKKAKQLGQSDDGMKHSARQQQLDYLLHEYTSQVLYTHVLGGDGSDGGL